MERRTLRSRENRKVSQRMAVVGEAERQQALAARLDALERDNYQVEEAFGEGSDDEEFHLQGELDEDDEVGGGSRKKKKRKVDGGMRKTRGMIADKTKGPRGFREWLDEAELDQAPVDLPTYLSVAAGPERTAAPRHYCSVCGDSSKYTCTRCGSRYCTIRCYGVHADTRCLKFMA